VITVVRKAYVWDPVKGEGSFLFPGYHMVFAVVKHPTAGTVFGLLNRTLAWVRLDELFSVTSTKPTLEGSQTDWWVPGHSDVYYVDQ
jgi:hypothetical protein